MSVPWQWRANRSYCLGQMLMLSLLLLSLSGQHTHCLSVRTDQRPLKPLFSTEPPLFHVFVCKISRKRLQTFFLSVATRCLMVRLSPRGRNLLLKFFAKRETTGDKMVTSSWPPFWPPLMDRRVSTLNTLRSRRWGGLRGFWLLKIWPPFKLKSPNSLTRFSPLLLRWMTERSKKSDWSQV